MPRAKPWPTVTLELHPTERRLLGQMAVARRSSMSKIMRRALRPELEAFIAESSNGSAKPVQKSREKQTA